jgi:large repetitive protein
MNHRLSARRSRGALVAASLFATVAGARDLPNVDALATMPAVKSATAAAQGVEFDPRLRVPRFLWGAQAPAVAAKALAAKRTADPEADARAVLRELAAMYRITPAEVDALPMHDLQRFANGGAVVRFRGSVGGVEVFREEVNVLLDAQGGLVAVSGHALGAPSAKLAEADPFATGPRTAIAAALADWRFPAGVAQQLALAGEADGYANYTLPAAVTGDDGAALATPVRAKRVLYRLPDELVPAYYVEVQVRDAANAGAVDAYSYVIAARDGKLLFRNNLTKDAAFTYRVYAETASPYLPLPGPTGRAAFPHPSAAPDGVQPALERGNLVTLESSPFSKNDPWLAPTANRTQGNNVEAFSDAFTPDGFNPPGTDECNIALAVDGDLHACASSGAFDYTYNFAAPPNAGRPQVAAAVTNVFYTVNWLHDWFYDAGFDEAARNAQTNNYGRGGTGNDSIIAEIQDYSATNNANMTTPSDGGRPRMRQMLWTSSVALARVDSPALVAGTKLAGKADFGPQAFDLTGDVIAAVDAADSTGPTTTDGCTAYTNAGAVAGKIVLVDRGTCLFVDKAKLAQAAGAAALLVANNVGGNPPGMAGTDATITIPIVSLTQGDGAAIRAQLAGGVRMRVARQSSVARDGALDNGLVAHEWGHYLSNRLVNNANGIVANQASGLGEGWSDFVALLLLVKEADRNVAANANFNGTYALTQYPLGGPDFAPDAFNYAYYYGIRRYPYSRDMTKNPLTFRHVSDGVALPATPPMSPTASSGANSEVHNTGEVWTTMLWECYSNLLNDTGRLTFAQAQDRMRRYLVASLKMTPNDPTFITARDALLAVMQAQDVADRDLCMQGFAKRGAGVGAVGPDQLSEDNSGVVESFRATAEAPVATQVVEYYHATFDHYFVTNIPDEIAKLDNGTFVGWARTGESFRAYASGTPGAADVCRFFSTAFAPKSSHFYTPDAGECTKVKANPDWQFEAVVFGVPVPDAAGTCSAGTQPLYRLYNNGQGAAPNHRYTTSIATRSAMLAKGWIPEGYGALGVIACSPL